MIIYLCIIKKINKIIELVLQFYWILFYSVLIIHYYDIHCILLRYFSITSNAPSLNPHLPAVVCHLAGTRSWAWGPCKARPCTRSEPLPPPSVPGYSDARRRSAARKPLPASPGSPAAMTQVPGSSEGSPGAGTCRWCSRDLKDL